MTFLSVIMNSSQANSVSLITPAVTKTQVLSMTTPPNTRDLTSLSQPVDADATDSATPTLALPRLKFKTYFETYKTPQVDNPFSDLPSQVKPLLPADRSPVTPTNDSTPINPVPAFHDPHVALSNPSDTSMNLVLAKERLETQLQSANLRISQLLVEGFTVAHASLKEIMSMRESTIASLDLINSLSPAIPSLPTHSCSSNAAPVSHPTLHDPPRLDTRIFSSVPTFDAKAKAEADIFLEKIEGLARDFAVHESHWIRLLAYSLRDSPADRHWLDHHVVQPELNWTDGASAFLAHYLPADIMDTRIERFQQCAPLTTESLREFGDRYERLMRQAKRDPRDPDVLVHFRLRLPEALQRHLVTMSWQSRFEDFYALRNAAVTLAQVQQKQPLPLSPKPSPKHWCPKH